MSEQQHLHFRRGGSPLLKFLITSLISTKSTAAATTVRAAIVVVASTNRLLLPYGRPA